ncbi:MAG TPA: metalloregulator ArsR/SmtB family transcription factor [Dehalococcoidia bacterium]|nr:metalloregulator ArsR/SmtB family transcription factor [Dehalococcoidia bacterium]
MKQLEQTEQETRAVRMLRAMANPVRFRIVRLLAERDTCVCGELVEALPLAQSTVSEHLKVLKDAGIVRGTIGGPNTCYCLDPQALRFLGGVFGALEQQACC